MGKVSNEFVDREQSTIACVPLALPVRVFLCTTN
jgi:hypothetical protein